MELLIIIIIAICVLRYLKTKKSEDENVSEYCKNNYQKTTKREIDYSVYQRNNLLTKTEYNFFFKLKDKADENNYVIFPKVRMEDFIKVNVGDYRTRQKYRGYIKSRHIDFLLCDSRLNVLAAIELDDNTHNKKSSKRADEMKNNIYDAIGIPLFRIPVFQNYDYAIDSMFHKLTFK